LQFIESAKNN